MNETSIVRTGDIRRIDRDEMVVLAGTEYARLLALLRELGDDDWQRPTVCDGWDVHAMVLHLLGAAEANASNLENLRQIVRGRPVARRRGGHLVDGINAVQIADRRGMAPNEAIQRLEQVAPAAVRGRRRTPAPMRRLRVPGPTGDTITIGDLVDLYYTRDQWMHRIDLCAATDREPQLTADHDGRIVADLVRDWAARHGEPVVLELTGPAGGTYAQGAGGPHLTVDAVDFALAISGRAPADGLLAVPVPF